MKFCTLLPLASLLLLCGCESTGGQSGFSDFLKNAGSVLDSVMNELDAVTAKGRQSGSQQASRTPGAATASAGPASIGVAAPITIDGNTGVVALGKSAAVAPAAAPASDATAAEPATAGTLDPALFTGRNRLNNAEKHFVERLEGFPQNVMEAVLLAKQDGSPALEVDIDTGHVFADVGIRVVPERYAAFARSFREVLDAACAGKEERNVTFKEEQYQQDSFVAEGGVPSGDEDDEKGPFPVLVAAPEDPLRLSWPVSVYSLDGRMFDVLCKVLEERFPKTGVVEVWLNDKDGEPVCGEKLQVARNGAKDNATGGSMQCLPIALDDSYDKKVFIVPYAGVQTFRSGQSGLKLPKTAMQTGRIDLGEVSEEDLADVAAFEVRLKFQ